MAVEVGLALKGDGKEPLFEHPSIEHLLRAIDRSQNRYLNQQAPEGYWWYELESNVTITAEYLMLFHFLGLRDPQKERKMAQYLLSKQRDDGTWAIYFDGPGEVSTTVEAYFALKLAGYSPEESPMVRAREAILEMGGIEATRNFTKIFLAMFGQYPWRRLPAFPVEFMLLPKYFPISVYDFSSWARATLVPISVILHKRPVMNLPPTGGVEELWAPHPPVKHPYRWFSVPWMFEVLDAVLKCLEHLPVRPLEYKALRKVETWLLQHQEPTGDWGGIQPSMVNAILALHCLGYPSRHPVIQKGLTALENFTLEHYGQLCLQSCISPVWDTALTCMALLDSGLPKNHPSLKKAGQWLLDRQISAPGDWCARNPNLEPGGWAFEFQNDWYPDVDDSAVVLMVLKRLAPIGHRDEQEKIERGIRWTLGMRSQNGGWGAFDVNNDKEILNQIPFADLEANLDPPTADLTGRILEMMGQFGSDRDDPLARDAILFIRRTQEPDGCWWGRWGVNYIYGTWSVLCGLSSIGEDLSLAYVQKAVRWLKEHQNWDGGWGETCETYRRPELRGTGPSTPSQTAWAIMALMAAGDARSPEVIRGINYLLAHQEEDGSWSESYFTGTGFPKYFMIRYHNYRDCFPLMALGRYYASLADEPSSSSG